MCCYFIFFLSSSFSSPKQHTTSTTSILLCSTTTGWLAKNVTLCWPFVCFKVIFTILQYTFWFSKIGHLITCYEFLQWLQYAWHLKLCPQNENIGCSAEVKKSSKISERKTMICDNRFSMWSISCKPIFKCWVVSLNHNWYMKMYTFRWSPSTVVLASGSPRYLTWPTDVVSNPGRTSKNRCCLCMPTGPTGRLLLLV